MSYLDDVESELRAMLEEHEIGKEPDDILSYVRQKLLESYKNGAAAARRKPKYPNKKRASK